MRSLRISSMAGGRMSPGAVLAVAVTCMTVTAVLSICLGGVSLPLQQLWEVLRGEQSSAAARIILHVRLPRTAAALFAGAGLAGAGVIIQSLLNNPLAGPNIIGVNAGAGFAAVLCCALFPSATGLVPFAAFLGAMLAVMSVYGIAKNTGASRMTIILAGIAVNSLLNAASDAVHTFVPDTLSGSTSFRIGGLAGMAAGRLWLPCTTIGLALAFAYLLHNELDILALGDETARSLGLPVGIYRFLLLAAAACLAGASVSFAGLLGFVGLIVPHAARFFVGSETGWLLPLSAVLGAFILTLCDLLARLIFAPYELPVGIVLSFLGAPFFLWLIIWRRGGHSHD